MSSSAKNLRGTAGVSAWVGSVFLFLATTAGVRAAHPPAAERGRLDFLANAPLYFEANHGQADASAPFIARGNDCVVLLSPDAATVVLRQADPTGEQTSDPLDRLETKPNSTRTVRIALQNANHGGHMTGLEPMPGKANYFIGNDPAGWRTGVPLFGRVQVDEVYPGIRAVYYADESARLEYDFVLQPNARPGLISLRIEGADQVRVDANGDLVLKIGGDEIRQHRPVIYQNVAGVRKQIAGGYCLTGKATAGFRIGEYDRNLPLIIDPSLTFSTYVGGSKLEIGHAVGFDGSGNIYVAGETLSKGLAPENFATLNFQGTNFNGGIGVFGDAFVAKYDAVSNGLVYFTYIGGTHDDGAMGMFVDTNGDVYITGFTDSRTFPIVPVDNAIRSVITGRTNNAFHIPMIDAFVTELDPTGSQIIFSTLLGGERRDSGFGIVVQQDTNGANVYVAGLTESTNFVPTPNGAQATARGKQDGFVVKFLAGTTNVSYCTYVGGTNRDYASAIAVDSLGAAYITGVTASPDFPTNSVIVFDDTNSPNPQTFVFSHLNLHTNLTTETDAFVTKLSPDGSQFEYSTFLGGTGNDRGLAIAVDDTFHAYVTGDTDSKNFPVNVITLQGGGPLTNSFTFTNTVKVLGTNFTTFPTNIIIQPDNSTKFSTHVFVTKLETDGSAMIYSTVFGGKGTTDQGNAIAVDSGTGYAYVGGQTTSRSFFPTNILVFTSTNTFFSTNNPNYTSFLAPPTNSAGKKIHITDAHDGFIAVLGPEGTNFVNSIMVGGSAADVINALALDPVQGAIYFAGETTSPNFVTSTNAPQRTIGGGKKAGDAFVGRILLP
jgi:hypothetical protein